MTGASLHLTSIVRHIVTMIAPLRERRLIINLTENDSLL